MGKKTNILFLVLLMVPVFLFAAGSTGRLLHRAATEYSSFRYASAIRLLQRVLKKDPANIEAIEMLAGSYRNIRDYDHSMVWYEKLTRQSNIKPEWALYYAEALANNKKYETSEQWYRKYLELSASDRRAASFVNAYPDVSALEKNRNEWKVSYTNLNTAASEYSPMYYKGGLLFSSNRHLGTSRLIFEWDDTPFTDLYLVKDLNDVREVKPDSMMKAIRKAPRHYDRSVYRFRLPDKTEDGRLLLQDTLGRILSAEVQAQRLPGKVNTKYHEGPAVLMPDSSLMFTRNNYYKGRYGSASEGTNKLKMYIASGEGYKGITEFPYNSDEYSTGHPAVNADGTLLIFTSDMPGGYGGTDLYYCTRAADGAWNKPVNMGEEINTEGNEMFPYLYRDGTLFFASTGHAGLGGLDIFRVMLEDAKPVGAPINLGAPVNSPADDFGVIECENAKSGFFSSNRMGNDDIYRFSYHPYEVALQGVVRDSKTKETLANSLVTLHYSGKTDTLWTNSAGGFYKVIDKETDFDITAEKELYIAGRTFASSKGILHDSVVHVAIELSKTEAPQVAVINNCDSLKRTFATAPVYYDLDKSSIRPDARQELDKLADLMKAHPDITIIASSYCDSRASNTYNIELSRRRSLSAKNFLVSAGIDESRIKIEYYGESRLVNNCRDGVSCTEAEQQLNRRTEFNIIYKSVNLSLINCR